MRATTTYHCETCGAHLAYVCEATPALALTPPPGRVGVRERPGGPLHEVRLASAPACFNVGVTRDGLPIPGAHVAVVHVVDVDADSYDPCDARGPQAPMLKRCYALDELEPYP